MILDKIASVWRTSKSSATNYADMEVYASIACAIVPISKFDNSIPFAYEATHVLWVPYWLDVRVDDQFRYGRRLPDGQGNVAPYIYVVNGRMQYGMGIPQMAFYCSERE